MYYFVFKFSIQEQFPLCCDQTSDFAIASSVYPGQIILIRAVSSIHFCKFLFSALPYKEIKGSPLPGVSVVYVCPFRLLNYIKKETKYGEERSFRT